MSSLDKNPNGSSLASYVRRTKGKIAQLKAQIRPKVSVNLNAVGELIVRETIHQNGKVFYADTKVDLGTLFSQLRPLFEPLIALERLALLGSSVTERKVSHVVTDGKVTNEVERDSNGKPVYLANHLDRIRAVSDVFAEHPEAVQALHTLNKVIVESHDELDSKAKFNANNQGWRDHLNDVLNSFDEKHD